MADIRLLVNTRDITLGIPSTGVMVHPNTVIKQSVTETTYQSVDANGNVEVRDTTTTFTQGRLTQNNDFVSEPGWETAGAANDYKKPENVAWVERTYGYGGEGLLDEGKAYPTTNMWVYGDFGIPKDNPVSVFLKGTVDPVLDQVVLGTSLAKQSIDVAEQVAGGFVNPANALIKAGVEAARNFLQNSLSIGTHVLAVDVPYGFIGGQRAPNIDAVKRFKNEMWPFTTALTLDGVEVDTSQGGGVPALLRLVEESLRDEGDDHRPVFPGATAYLGLTLVVGTDVPGDVGKVFESMKKLGKLCATTFGTNPFTNVRAPGTDPEVQPVELKAEPMGPGVLLRWKDGVKEYPKSVDVSAEPAIKWEYQQDPTEFRIWGTCDAATSLTAPEEDGGEYIAPEAVPTSDKWVLLGTDAGREDVFTGAVLGAFSGVGMGNTAGKNYYFRVREADLLRLDATAAGTKPGRGPYYFAVQHVYKDAVKEITAAQQTTYVANGSAVADTATPLGMETGTIMPPGTKSLVATSYVRVTYTPKPTAPSNGVAPDWWGGSVSMSDAQWWDRSIGSLPDFLDAKFLRPLTEDLTDINDGLQKYLEQMKKRVDDFEKTVAQVKEVSRLIQELMDLRVGLYARAFQTVASPAQLDALYNNDGDWTAALFSGVSENPDGTGEMTRPAPKTGLDALMQEYRDSLSQLPFQKDTDLVGGFFVVVPLPATPGAELEKIVNAWNTLMQFLGLAKQQLGQLSKDWENWGINWEKMYERETPQPEAEPDFGRSQGAMTHEDPPLGEDDVWARQFRPGTDLNCPGRPDYSRLAMTDSFQVVRPPVPPIGETLATINITHRFTRSR